VRKELMLIPEYKEMERLCSDILGTGDPLDDISNDSP